MSLIYSDTPAPFTGKFDLAKADANKHWLTHYRNSLYLTFMMKNGNQIERHKASKEMEIADRKMNYWKRHHNFSQEQSLRDAQEAKKEWGAAL